MTPFTARAQRSASDWQKEKCAELEAFIYIQERMLDSFREELKHTRSLEGAELTARYGWETPEEVAKLMENKHAWMVKLGHMWVENAGEKRSA